MGRQATLPVAQYRLDEMGAVMTLLQDIANRVLTGELDVRRCQVAAYVASIAVRAIEGVAFERRLAALEEAILKPPVRSFN